MYTVFLTPNVFPYLPSSLNLHGNAPAAPSRRKEYSSIFQYSIITFSLVLFLLVPIAGKTTEIETKDSEISFNAAGSDQSCSRLSTPKRAVRKHLEFGQRFCLQDQRYRLNTRSRVFVHFARDCTFSMLTTEACLALPGDIPPFAFNVRSFGSLRSLVLRRHLSRSRTSPIFKTTLERPRVANNPSIEISEARCGVRRCRKVRLNCRRHSQTLETLAFLYTRPIAAPKAHRED